MKPKTLALLCVAVGCGLVAMIGVQQAMSKPSAAKMEMVQVLEALADIDPGVTLTEENVAFKEIPKAAASEDAVTTIEEYQKRSLTVAVLKGERILKGKLSAPGVSGKSTQIPKGKTVVTINVDETQTASNMMKAGDFVDVNVTYDARTPNGVQTKTMTLLERVVVFAIGDLTKNDMARKTADNQSVKARQVSLIINYEEANSLVLAERKGQLRLLWRNPTDMELHTTKAITEGLLTELRGLDMQGDRPAYEQSENARAEEPKPEQVAEAPKQSVTTFLAQATPPVQAPVTSVKPVDPKEMWEVKVYVRNDVQSFPFELPSAHKDEAQPLPSAAEGAGGFLKTFGFSLPWKSQGAKADGTAESAKQAL
jgi:pilus assembly protein CpaB